jgi:hypothetical protein
MQRGLQDRLNRKIGKQGLRMRLYVRPELPRMSASLVN